MSLSKTFLIWFVRINLYLKQSKPGRVDLIAKPLLSGDKIQNPQFEIRNPEEGNSISIVN
jgi:hypothetical protein